MINACGDRVGRVRRVADLPRRGSSPHPVGSEICAGASRQKFENKTSVASDALLFRPPVSRSPVAVGRQPEVIRYQSPGNGKGQRSLDRESSEAVVPNQVVAGCFRTLRNRKVAGSRPRAPAMPAIVSTLMLPFPRSSFI